MTRSTNGQSTVAKASWSIAALSVQESDQPLSFPAAMAVFLSGVSGYRSSCEASPSIDVSVEVGKGSKVCTMLCAGSLDSEEERFWSWSRVLSTAANVCPKFSRKKDVVCWLLPLVLSTSVGGAGKPAVGGAAGGKEDSS